MYSTIMTAVLDGIHMRLVAVEVDIRDGLPVFEMVGYLSAEVREARERVKTALHHCGVTLPAKRITVNLSPANLRKSGSAFDLPITVAILCALGVVEETRTEGKLFLGELGLKGQLLGVNGILPVIAEGIAEGITAYVIPAENLSEALLVPDAGVYAFSDLTGLIGFLKGQDYLAPVLPPARQPLEETVDFSQVNGQSFLKRACEVSAAGMHNLLMIGPPGTGKTMISERMATILPPLTKEEQLELSKIYSICGLMKNRDSLVTGRPFRSPHHTITQPGLVGGGTNPVPGEISLAHHGVLFLDELPEYHKSTLEVLRQPMEEHKVRISRVNGSVTYPADFLLLASMNPCNCGYYPNMQKCRCTPGSIRRYLSHISQPLIDRMDICVEAPALSFSELTGSGGGESSAVIRERVKRCHDLQYERYRELGFYHNSSIPADQLARFCPLGEKELRYMEDMYRKLSMTARTYHKVLRVARTIADLAESEKITLAHLNEAICYRSIDQKFWGGVGI